MSGAARQAAFVDEERRSAQTPDASATITQRVKVRNGGVCRPQRGRRLAPSRPFSVDCWGPRTPRRVLGWVCTVARLCPGRRCEEGDPQDDACATANCKAIAVRCNVLREGGLDGLQGCASFHGTLFDRTLRGSASLRGNSWGTFRTRRVPRQWHATGCQALLFRVGGTRPDSASVEPLRQNQHLLTDTQD